MSVDVDRISAEAARVQIRPGRAVLTVVGSVFWAIGWTARRTVFAATWSWAAIRLGWAEGAPPAAKR